MTTFHRVPHYTMPQRWFFRWCSTWLPIAPDMKTFSLHSIYWEIAQCWNEHPRHWSFNCSAIINVWNTLVYDNWLEFWNSMVHGMWYICILIILSSIHYRTNLSLYNGRPATFSLFGDFTLGHCSTCTPSPALVHKNKQQQITMCSDNRNLLYIRHFV